MRLGKPERNLLLGLILRLDLEVHDFDLRTDVSDDTLIVHPASGSSFRIGLRNRNAFGEPVIWLLLKVGERTPEELSSPNYHAPFLEWLQDVKAESEAPDLWAQLSNDRAILQAAAEGKVDDSPFTGDEQEHILAAIDALAHQMRTDYELTADQMKQVEAKLDGLRDEAKRSGRERWFTYAVGTLDLLQMTVLPDGAARHLTLGLVKAVGHLFGLHLPELPAP